MRIQKCEGCGKEFEAARSTRRWCEGCRVLQRRVYVKRHEQHQRQANDKREPRSLATCAWCGNNFIAMRSDAKTCSPACQHQAELAKARRYEQTHRSTCPKCGASTTRRSVQCRACGYKSRIEKISGENNYAWKGGRITDSYGYIHILVARNQYRPEHVLVWEKANGKPVPKGWIVHHLNHIKNDNRPENLVALPRKEHNHRHGERRIKELEAEIELLRSKIDWKS